MDPADSDGISRVPPYSGGALRQSGISRMGLSPAVAGLSRPSRYALCRVVGAPTTPAAPERRGFGLCPGRSPLLGVSLLFSLPAGTGMFRFPAFASPLGDDGFFSRRVAPFGLPRVKGHLHLAGVFRGLSRPSSPPGARASTARPRSLNSSICWPTPLAITASRRGPLYHLYYRTLSPLPLSFSLLVSSCQRTSTATVTLP